MKTTKLLASVSIAIIGLTMTAAPLSAEANDNAPSAHKEGHVLGSYNLVATALYKDDLATAKKAAKEILKHDKNGSLTASAQKLSEAATIEEARKVFNALSAAAIKVAKTEQAYKVAHCPMANGGKGGDWIQRSSDKIVNNPYFGAKMAHCGSFKK
jgi:hypothetical protein